MEKFQEQQREQSRLMDLETERSKLFKGCSDENILNELNMLWKRKETVTLHLCISNPPLQSHLRIEKKMLNKDAKRKEERRSVRKRASDSYLNKESLLKLERTASTCSLQKTEDFLSRNVTDSPENDDLLFSWEQNQSPVRKVGGKKLFS